jgi:response regulator NasT
VKVLLADNNPERADLVAAALSGTAQVARIGLRESLLDAVRRAQADLVLVDMGRPDRDGLEALRALRAHAPLPVVLFVDHDDAAFMRDAIAAGVSSYNVVGASMPDVKVVIRVAVALFDRYSQIEGDLRRAEEQLEERALIARAKTVLMRRHGLSEPDAYRRLRRRAMESQKRIVDVAGQIMAAAERLE